MNCDRPATTGGGNTTAIARPHSSLRLLRRLCEHVARQDVNISVCLRVRYFDKRPAICARIPIFRIKVHWHVAFATHHLSMLGVMTIMPAVALTAACKRDVNGVVIGPLDHDL